MALPDSRNTTYAANDPVKAADLNAMQDMLVAGGHGPLTLTVFGAFFHPLGTVLPILNAGGGNTGNHNWSISQGFIQGVLPFPPGTIITSVAWYYARVADMYFRIGERHADGTTTSWRNDLISGGPQTMTEFVVGQVISANRAAYLEVVGEGGSANTFYGARIAYRKPS